MNQEYRDFILKHADWTKWHQDELLTELQWAEQHALIVETREGEELMELGIFVATGYPETVMSTVMAGHMGAYDPHGRYVFCPLYVKHKKLSGTRIDWKRLREHWIVKYPHVQELCYRAHRHDGKLVRSKFRH